MRYIYVVMADFPEEKLIHTRELPIVSFCAYCDKPIYIGEEYEEVEYYDVGEDKHHHKKHLVKGYAHVHCIKEKEHKVEELKDADKKSHQRLLALSIVIGFVFALALMLILIFANKDHLALDIILPLVSGYALASELLVLFSETTLGEKYRSVSMKLIKSPSWIKSLHSESDIFIVVKILMFVILVPLAYLSLVVLFMISLLISMVAFPIVIIKKK